MQRTTLPSRRATRRPSKPVQNHSLAVASLSVALGMAVGIPATGIAQASAVEGGNPAVNVSSLANQARNALTTNAPIAVSAEASWGAPNVDIEVKHFDARAARRAKAQEEAAKRHELALQRQQERAARRADRSNSREDLTEGAEALIPAGNSSVTAIAKQYLGVPYVWGGSTPRGFDCSGFTRYVYRQVGINLPHQSSAQMRRGTRVSAAEARPGDLVWHPGHVGIYLGNGKMIHAPRPGRSVEIVSVNYSRGHSFYRVG